MVSSLKKFFRIVFGTFRQGSLSRIIPLLKCASGRFLGRRSGDLWNVLVQKSNIPLVQISFRYFQNMIKYKFIVCSILLYLVPDPLRFVLGCMVPSLATSKDPTLAAENNWENISATWRSRFLSSSPSAHTLARELNGEHWCKETDKGGLDHTQGQQAA